MPEYRRKKQYSGIKKPRNKLFRGIGWGIGIRTPTNRVRVCRATVTPFLNVYCSLLQAVQSTIYIIYYEVRFVNTFLKKIKISPILFFLSIVIGETRVR